MTIRLASGAFVRRFAALLAGTLVLAGAAVADPPGRVGRLAEVRGTVWFHDAEQGEWVAAQRNRPLTSGDRLSAEGDARAVLQIGSSTLRLAGDSELLLQRVDDERVELRLERGSVALRVRSTEFAHEVALDTDEGRFEPVMAGHYRIDRERDSSFATAWSGVLRFDAADSTLDVTSGRRAEFWSDGGRTHYSWLGPQRDTFARWAEGDDRDDERDIRHVSAEMTGSGDLAQHGRWQSHPEYGMVWFPHRVAAGWAPYRYGHWAWVQPWGWTWVDDAPWGFAPFHYGRWVHWGGHWGWMPGRYVARPIYAPALVGWIGGPRLSVGISIGSPNVGWVPLGPWEPWWPHYSVSPRYEQRINDPHWRDRDRDRRDRDRHDRDRRDRRDRGDGDHDRRDDRRDDDRRGARPGEPGRWINRGMPGGVTVVSGDALGNRRPVSAALVSTPPELGPVEAVNPPPRRRVVAPPELGDVSTPPRRGVTPPELGAVEPTRPQAPRPDRARPDRVDRGPERETLRERGGVLSGDRRADEQRPGRPGGRGLERAPTSAPAVQAPPAPAPARIAVPPAPRLAPVPAPVPTAPAMRTPSAVPPPVVAVPQAPSRDPGMRVETPRATPSVRPREEPVRGLPRDDSAGVGPGRTIER